MASHIEQALVWWAKLKDGYIPARHFRVLSDAKLIRFDDFKGRYELTLRGKRAFLEVLSND